MLWLQADTGKLTKLFRKAWVRFLMNTMLASGGYPWTVIPVEERGTYRAALEEASVGQNIVLFTEFLARLVDNGLKGKSFPKVPS